MEWPKARITRCTYTFRRKGSFEYMCGNPEPCLLHSDRGDDRWGWKTFNIHYDASLEARKRWRS